MDIRFLALHRQKGLELVSYSEQSEPPPYQYVYQRQRTDDILRLSQSCPDVPNYTNNVPDLEEYPHTDKGS